MREADRGIGTPRGRDMREADMLVKRGGRLTISITSFCPTLGRSRIIDSHASLLGSFHCEKSLTEVKLEISSINADFLHSFQQL